MAGRVQVAWFPTESDDEWNLVKVLSKSTSGAVLAVGSSEVTVPPQDLSKFCPGDGAKASQNFTELELDGIGAERVEATLRGHFCSNLPYTRVEDVLLAVQPFRDLPIYDSKFIDTYAALDPALPPHIYATAALAYKHMVDHQQAQVIVLLGEPCAGKSEKLGRILDFILHTAGGDEDSDSKVAALQGLLTPFVSVRCEGIGSLSKPWLSTRALVAIHLEFDDDGFLCQTAAEIHALELGHVSAAGEVANFHIFCVALRDQSAKQWIGDAEEFRLLGEAPFDLADDPDTLDADVAERFYAAASEFGIDPAPVVRTACAIMLLGEVDLSSIDGEMDCGPPEAVLAAAKALDISAEDLRAVLLDPDAKFSALSALSVLIEELFKLLVAWMLRAANAAMVAPTPPAENLRVSVLELPSWPGSLASLRSTDFDALRLQWLLEAVNARLLPSSACVCQGLATDAAPDLKLLDSQASAMNALEAINGQHGVLEALRKLVGTPDLATAGSILQECAMGIPGWERSSEGEWQCSIHGSITTTGIRFNASLLHAATGKGLARSAREMFRSSSATSFLLTEGNDAFGFDDMVSCVDFATTQISVSRDLRPWFVVCLRPNDTGSNTLVTSRALLRQVKAWRLEDMAVLCRATTNRRFTEVAWSFAHFRERFRALAPSLEDAQDRQFCLFLVGSIGGGQGIVSSQTVYGSTTLRDILETKLSELEHGAKQLHAHERRISAQVSEKLAAHLQKVASGTSLHGVASRTSLHGVVSGTSLLGETEFVPQVHAEFIAPEPEAQDLGGTLEPETREPETRERDAGSALHTALTRMAAALRVAQESDAKHRSERLAAEAAMAELRQECEAWRLEADRLWCQLRG